MRIHVESIDWFPCEPKPHTATELGCEQDGNRVESGIGDTVEIVMGWLMQENGGKPGSKQAEGKEPQLKGHAAAGAFAEKGCFERLAEAGGFPALLCCKLRQTESQKAIIGTGPQVTLPVGLDGSLSRAQNRRCCGGAGDVAVAMVA